MSWSSFYGVILMTKKDVIQLLEKIAIYMELKGENTFKVSAYRKAAPKFRGWWAYIRRDWWCNRT